VGLAHQFKNPETLKKKGSFPSYFARKGLEFLWPSIVAFLGKFHISGVSCGSMFVLNLELVLHLHAQQLASCLEY
jgi:hypothetical protein